MTGWRCPVVWMEGVAPQWVDSLVSVTRFHNPRFTSQAPFTQETIRFRNPIATDGIRKLHKPKLEGIRTIPMCCDYTTFVWVLRGKHWSWLWKIVYFNCTFWKHWHIGWDGWFRNGLQSRKCIRQYACKVESVTLKMIIVRNSTLSLHVEELRNCIYYTVVENARLYFIVQCN